ncbi:hypothetical protein EBS43_02950 [bacterium]|nr:hypothetical protein [bacterium]
MARTDLVIGIFFKHSIGELQVQKIAESCYRITPQVAIRETQSIFLEVSQSLSLFTVRGIVSRVHVILKNYSVSAQVYLATDPFRCLAKAYLSEDYTKSQVTSENKIQNASFISLDDLPWSQLPIDALYCFFDPFRKPHEEEDKEIKKLIHLMKAMGVLNFDVFLKIPIKSIGSRFGKIGLLLYEHALGTRKVVWQYFQVQNQIEEFIDVDSDLEGESFDYILFISKSLLDSISMRLRARTLRVNRLLIEFKLKKSFLQSDDLSSLVRSFDFQLPIAQGSTLGILPIIRESLSFYFGQSPLLSPICSILIRVLETSPGHATQKNFFHTDDFLVEAHDQLLNRLIARIGKENVFYANSVDSYSPEKAWTKTLCFKQKNVQLQSSKLKSSESQSSFIQSDEDSMQRPTRILKKPQSLEFESFEVLYSHEKTWRVLYWIGPERLVSEWWISSPVHEVVNRDYYQILTESREKLWVFFDRNFNPPQLFLHGYFD